MSFVNHYHLEVCHSRTILGGMSIRYSNGNTAIPITASSSTSRPDPKLRDQSRSPEPQHDGPVASIQEE